MISREYSTVLLIDFQPRLMAVIEGAPERLENAARLSIAADRFGIGRVITEQNPKALGATPAELLPETAPVFAKMDFDATADPQIAAQLAKIPKDHALIVAGCEAHICVLQTVLALRAGARKVYVVADAVGARRAENRQAALARMALHGAEIVTTEMVLFEWLRTATNPAFKEIVGLIK